jgi:hypothetical protein
MLVSSSTQSTGAPYLARFSRDVGYHCSFPLTLDSSDALSGQRLVWLNLALKLAVIDDPINPNLRAPEAKVNVFVWDKLFQIQLTPAM